MGESLAIGVVNDSLVVAVVITTLLASIVLFMAIKYRAKILSPRGREVIRGETPKIRMAGALGMVSLFVYLAILSSRIINGISLDYELGIHYYIGELVHLSLLVVMASTFLHLLYKIKGVEG